MPPRTTTTAERLQTIASPTHKNVESPTVYFTKELMAASAAIDKKVAGLGGAPGAAVGVVQPGAGDGYFRNFANGVIYVKAPAGPCWVHGAILGKYLAAGGEGGFLGYPTTDEITTPDGHGRYTHFEGGSIYWSAATGAHEVHGVIRDRWSALGWERGWLGYPITDERPFAQGGRVSSFEHGAVYWWPDVGAIDLGNVAVRYKGLYCFGETSELSSADEPYVIFGVVPAPPVAESTAMSQVYSDVDSGDSRPDVLELYRGGPFGAALGIALWEHDEGDRDTYLDQVKQGVALVGKGLKEGCVALFGADAAPVCEGIWSAVGPSLVEFVNGVVGSDDDLVEKWFWNLTAKEMVTLAGSAVLHFWGIDYHLESKLLSDGEASYKIYLEIVRV